MEAETLAWRKFPEPNGVSYLKKDLIDRTKVVELFDYCQIREAFILDKGWEFLFDNYGLREIIEIDKESGWLEDEDLGGWITSFFLQSLISGFDPLNKVFGKYSEDTGVFKDNNGSIREINWKEVYNLKEKLLTT